MWASGKIDSHRIDLINIPTQTSMIIIKQGEIIKRTGAYAQLNSLRSMSKALTAVAILQAHDEGLLDLKLNLAPLLENYNINVPVLTINDMLNQHILAHEKLFSYDVSKHTSEDTIHHIFNNDFHLINEFNYTNTSYYLLGVLLENNFGKGFLKDLIINKIYNPLHIESYEFKDTADGYTYAASSMKLSTENLSKIAFAIYNSEIINMKHIVEIQNSPNIASSSNRLNLQLFNKRFYQFGFWVGGGNIFYADGKNGQTCIIDKYNEMVIVALSENYDTNELLREIEKTYVEEEFTIKP